MSIVNNSYIAAAAAALGQTVPAGASPIVEQLLNDVAVSAIDAAEVNEKGKCLVLVTTPDGVRPVADTAGNVKLFADGAAVVADTEALGDKVNALLADVGARREMGEHARAVVLRNQGALARTLSHCLASLESDD